MAVCAAVACTALHAQQDLYPNGNALPASVAQALARAQVPASAATVAVQEIGARDYKVAHNLQTAVNPASLMKLVTTYAALEMLTPAYQWKTGVYVQGTVNGNGVLEGDLLLKGSGDPKLVIENLWMLLRRVQAAGIREIRGDIVLDRSAFDIAELDTARFDNDPTRPYNVGADALLLNYKSVSFSFIPNGNSVVVGAEPRLAGMQLPASVRTSNGNADCGDWKSKLAADFSDFLAPRFAGSFAPACGEKQWHVAALSAQRYAQALLTQLWADSGGKLSGQVKEGRVGNGARLLLEWTSPPLSEVIRDINKFSNNVMARQLFLTIASEVTQQSATAAAAERAIKDWARDRGMAMPELLMENGSGLSRVERISGASLTRLLQAAYASPAMPELMSSLPITGQDGTMRRRKGHVATGSAHIKTGSLRDVRGIAGYVLAANGKRYAVVAIINHPNAAATQDALDAVLAYAYNGARDLSAADDCPGGGTGGTAAGRGGCRR
jgi:D-alanyl-D-alanine carboxypeptidase/D-alanyl-D-alanine-endopeptidase (penicillin-binding protein 4)